MSMMQNRNMQFFLLKRALGLTNQEIAEGIGRPYKTVEGWSGGVMGKNPPESAIRAMQSLLRAKLDRDAKLLTAF